MKPQTTPLFKKYVRLSRFCYRQDVFCSSRWWLGLYYFYERAFFHRMIKLMIKAQYYEQLKQIF